MPVFKLTFPVSVLLQKDTQLDAEMNFCIRHAGDQRRVWLGRGSGHRNSIVRYAGGRGGSRIAKAWHWQRDDDDEAAD